MPTRRLMLRMEGIKLRLYGQIFSVTGNSVFYQQMILRSREQHVPKVGMPNVARD